MENQTQTNLQKDKSKYKYRNIRRIYRITVQILRIGRMIGRIIEYIEVIYNFIGMCC